MVLGAFQDDPTNFLHCCDLRNDLDHRDVRGHGDGVDARGSENALENDQQKVDDVDGCEC